jgi:hypothetical protein
MVIECDAEVPECTIRSLEALDGVLNVTYISMEA